VEPFFRNFEPHTFTGKIFFFWGGGGGQLHVRFFN